MGGNPSLLIDSFLPQGSDYIHANFVSGYNKPEAFILTQGTHTHTHTHTHALIKLGNTARDLRQMKNKVLEIAGK